MKKLLLTITILMLMMSVGHGENDIAQIRSKHLEVFEKVLDCLFNDKYDEALAEFNKVYGESPIQLTISSDKKVFTFGEDITFFVNIKNLTSKEIDAPSLYWLIKVLVDGKEYSINKKHIGNWNGPGILIPEGYFGAGITLSNYDINKDILMAGKHDILLKIGSVLSNKITIEVAEKQFQPLQLAIKSDKQVYEVGEPIVLTATLKNISSYNYVYLIPDVYDNNSRFWEIDTKDGKTERIRPYGLGTLHQDDYKTLSAGQAISYAADITTIWKLAPGIYRIKARYKGENWYKNPDGGIAEMAGVFWGTLTSNTITIEVVGKQGVRP